MNQYLYDNLKGKDFDRVMSVSRSIHPNGTRRRTSKPKKSREAR